MLAGGSAHASQAAEGAGLVAALVHQVRDA
jgi:hypothetical protein